MENYVIETRYEYRSNSGIQFTKWYIQDSTPRIKEDADNRIQELKKSFDYIDKKTKLIHEYRLKKYDDYLADMNCLNNEVKKLIEDQQKYYKSDEYKKLIHKKYESAKERKKKLD